MHCRCIACFEQISIRRCTAVTESSPFRNMDIQISMMAASDDDCTLGAHFCTSFGFGDCIDAVRLFSGKQCASVSQLRVQAAGLQLVKRLSPPTTITNFFREFKETHAICFHPDLKIEKCQLFLDQVAPDLFETISEAHQQKVQEFELQMGERRKAILEAENEKKEAVVTQLKEAIDGHILQHFPLEFFALKTGEVNCSICLRARVPWWPAILLSGFCFELGLGCHLYYMVEVLCS